MTWQGVSLRLREKVICLPIAACHVDAGQNDLVRKVVNVYCEPPNAFVFPSKVDFVEYDRVDEVHDNCSAK